MVVTPALVDADGIKIAISESDVTSYPGMLLKPFGSGLEARFAGYPAAVQQGGKRNLQWIVTSRENYIATCDGKARLFPWRVVCIARSDRELASDNLITGCLVLEGGAFRGLYTQGVLDYWMLNDINISDVIGVSAGALSAVAYVTGQIGRSARVNIGYRHDTNYIGVGAIRRAHSPINLDFLIHDYDRIEPLDMERFNDPRRRLVAVATDCGTGKTVYFERGKCSDMFTALKATATMP